MASASDPFTGTGGAPLVDPPWITQPGMAAPVQRHTLTSNEARDVGSGDWTKSQFRASVVDFSDDQECTVVIGALDDTLDYGMGGAVRMHPTQDTQYFVLMNTLAGTGEFQVFSVVNSGTPIQIAQYGAGASPSTGESATLRAVAGKVSLIRGSTEVIPPTSNATVASGQPGIVSRVFNAVPTVQSWSAQDVSSVPGPSAAATDYYLPVNQLHG